tara:strand:+ start:881 stop:1807 length:927 start_codon:yes stop_codon:yes gene_type:complete
MSRRNNKTKSKPVDNTKNNVYSGGGNNRKVFKKVGHKGDYAIVENKSSQITLNKTGSGTSGSPYVYSIGLQENLSNILSDYKTKNSSLNTKLREIKTNITKRAKEFKNLEEAKNILNFESTFDFKNIEKQYVIPTQVLNNNTSVECMVSKESSQDSMDKNNCFYIRFEKNEFTGAAYVEYSMDNSNLVMCIIDIKKEYIKFKIKEINTNNYITYRALSKHDNTKIKFVIEWGKKPFIETSKYPNTPIEASMTQKSTNKNNNTNDNIVMNTSNSSNDTGVSSVATSSSVAVSSSGGTAVSSVTTSSSGY